MQLMLLMLGLAGSVRAAPAVREFKVGPAEVMAATEAVLAGMNLPLVTRESGRIVTTMVETDTATLSGFIDEPAMQDCPGWERCRLMVEAAIQAAQPNRTGLQVRVSIERFGVRDARVLLPPVWESVRSNGHLERQILDAVSDRLEHQGQTGSGSPENLSGLPAGLDNPPFIPNVAASHDPGTGNQNETTVRSFDRNMVYGAWNDNRTGVYHVGFGHSSDAGQTWLDTIMNGPLYSEDGDPCLCTDDSGTVYYFWLNFDRAAYVGAVHLIKSTNGGLTWGSFVNCTPGSGSSLNDKPWAMVDGNNVYLTDYDYGESFGLLFRRSTDRGATWGDPVQVGSSGNGTFPFRGTDSTIYVGWGFQDINLNKSTNMGRTWTGARTVVNCTWNPGSTPWRLNNVPSFGTSRDRTRLYVVFADSRLRANQLDAFFSRSTDAGANWSTPVKLNDNTNPNDTTRQFYPFLSVDPQDRIHAVWYDCREGGGKIAEYYTLSTDFGLTWSANQRVSDTAAYSSTFIGDYNSCFADSWNIHALWSDTRRGASNPDAFASHASLAAVRDVGCTRILAPIGTVDSGTVVTPACSVYNYGTGAASYRVRMKIGSLYDTVAQVVAQPSGERLRVIFPDWTTVEIGSFAVTCSTELTSDDNSDNDRASDSVDVVPQTGVSEETGALGQGRLSLTVSPNPGRADVGVCLSAGSAGPGSREVQIRDVTGRMVRSLQFCRTGAVTTRVSWDARDAAGGRAPAGVYYARVKGFEDVTRIVLVE